MYYCVSSTSVGSGRARTPSRVREGGEHRDEGPWSTGPARGPGYLLRPRPRHAQAQDQSARARTNAGARKGLLVPVTWRSRLRLLPCSSPFPSIWVSFFPFLLFFSMNTHRVHLKATLPHFTASFSSSLLRFPLQFKLEKKNNRT